MRLVKGSEMSDRRPSQPSFAEMLGEVVNLIAGLTVLLLPVLLISVPGVLLVLVLPVVLVLAVAAVPALLVGAVLAPPFLLVRLLRRRRVA